MKYDYDKTIKLMTTTTKFLSAIIAVIRLFKRK